MSGEELIRLREESKADPPSNYSFNSRRQIEKNSIKGVQNVMELNDLLTSELNRNKGSSYERLIFFNEFGNNTGKLKLFGPSLNSVINNIKRLNLKVNLPGLRPANRIFLPGPLRLAFMDYSSNLAFVNSKIVHYMGLKCSSYHAKIKGTGLRLYFSPDVRGPLCGSDHDISPCGPNGEIVNLGSIVLPVKLMQKIYGRELDNITKIPEDPQAAIEAGIKNGIMHPNYSIPKLPPGVLKSRINGLEFKFSSWVHQYFAVAGISTSFDKSSIFVTDKVLGPVLEAIMDGRLSGVKMPNSYIDEIEIIEQKKGWGDLNRYHGLIPIYYKNNRQMISEAGLRYCSKCNRSTPFRICEQCGSRTEKLYFCSKCKKPALSKTCPNCGSTTTTLTASDIELSASLELASRKMGIEFHSDIMFPEKNIGEIEDVRKSLLRRRVTLKASKCGISVYYIAAEVADLGPDEIIIPNRLSSSLLEVARFIDMELEEIYGAQKVFSDYTPEQLIGKSVILLNRDLSAGIRVKIKGIGRGLEALINQGALSSLGLGVRDMGFYVALESDIILNYSGKYCKPARRLNIYDSNIRKSMPQIQVNYTVTSSQENIIDLSKSLIQLMSSLKDKKGALPQLVKTLILIEKIYNSQKHICFKCGRKYALPPISYTCPRCGTKLYPEYDTEMINSIVISLGNIVEKLESNERDEIEMALERFQSIFKSSNQLSLSDFS